MPSVIRVVSAWMLVAFYAGAIFIGSSLSHPPLVSSVALPFFDKVCHFIEYGGLTLLLIRALSVTSVRCATSSLVIWAIVLVVVYGASDELHQAFTPERMMSGYDLLADAAAAAVVAGFWLLARRRWSSLVKL
jgi:VanZ family protein